MYYWLCCTHFDLLHKRLKVRITFFTKKLSLNSANSVKKFRKAQMHSNFCWHLFIIHILSWAFRPNIKRSQKKGSLHERPLLVKVINIPWILTLQRQAERWWPEPLLMKARSMGWLESSTRNVCTQSYHWRYRSYNARVEGSASLRTHNTRETRRRPAGDMLILHAMYPL